MQGSPPLARGTDFFVNRYELPLRITPACAGNSCAVPIFQGRRGDHPRLRGEQTKKRLAMPYILYYRILFFNQFFINEFRGMAIAQRPVRVFAFYSVVFCNCA